MRVAIATLVALLISTAPLHAGGKNILDTWDIVYLGDGKAGYVHTVATETEVDGKKYVQTTVELRLTVKRFKDIIEMAMDTGTTETRDGEVTGTFMKQYLARTQRTRIDGVVAGNQLRLTLNGDTPLKPAPWNKEVIGLFKQQSMFKDRNLKPGDKFTYQSFEPTINLVIKAEVTAKGYREVALKGKAKRKLLLVEMVPEKLDVKQGGDKVQLPASLIWLDDDLQPVKTEVEVPLLGPLTMYRTTKEKALAPGPLANVDLGYSQLVKLKNRILDPFETTAAVYRVTIRNDDNVATTFSRDDRQEVKNVKGNTFELHVKASKPTGGAPDAKEPGEEFMQTSYFITSADAKVKERARAAVGNETDPLKKARRIETWVHNNMKWTFHEALATADHVARTLEGDCTEFAMLMAAMCRAEGLPSRTAIGLIYADVKGAPCFGFHMWTEVWIKGRWVAFDATIGKGHVAATHLKITDHSWHDERTMTPIFPVIRVVGRVQIDVLSAE